MNYVRKGSDRDRLILELVRKYRCLNTEQVASLAFSFPTGLTKAQQRLKRLKDGGHLARTRVAIDEPYTYYLSSRPAQIQHMTAINWAILWLKFCQPSWDALEHFEYEPDYDFLRPDAFCCVRNKVLNTKRFYFVEMDRSENRFDKVQKYNKLYASGEYADRAWVQEAERFPIILCIMERAGREKVIQKAIDNDNKHGLRFQVHRLDKMRREVMSWRLFGKRTS